MNEQSWTICDSFLTKLGVSWFRWDFKMLAHCLEHLNLEIWKFVFKCHFAKAVDIIHHWMLDTNFGLYSYTGFLEHLLICLRGMLFRKFFIIVRLSVIAESFLAIWLLSLSRDLRKKISGFKALKAIPFYLTFVCHQCCENC